MDGVAAVIYLHEFLAVQFSLHLVQDGRGGMQHMHLFQDDQNQFSLMYALDFMIVAWVLILFHFIMQLILFYCRCALLLRRSKRS